MTPTGGGVAVATLLRRLPKGSKMSGNVSAFADRIAIDSREVRPGTLFVALRGEHADGHDFVGAAVAKGASGIVVEHGRAGSQSRELAVLEVDDTRRALSMLASGLYNEPSRLLRVIGVTGTNGKTTTTRMIAEIAREAGIPCGVIGTVGAQFGSRRWQLANTTPFPHELHEILAEMRDDGARAVAMEVSSHALALDRVEDVRFFCAALTNVTRDHLDFHETQEAYAAAKRRLFSMSTRSVLNADDEYGRRWAVELAATNDVTTYALRERADIVASNVEVSASGSTFTVRGRAFSLPLPARFNVSNALCALGVARALGIADDVSAKALDALPPVPGRMERIADRGIDVVVDYAHTPDALEQALRALRETTRGRLFVVFGCGGERDRGKRPQMGAIAAALADRAYVTNDNPRHENPQSIANDILAGMKGLQFVLELDRRNAIERALRDAEPGDAVLVAGKGHEAYQILGDRKVDFDDASVVRDALAKRAP